MNTEVKKFRKAFRAMAREYYLIITTRLADQLPAIPPLSFNDNKWDYGRCRRDLHLPSGVVTFRITLSIRSFMYLHTHSDQRNTEAKLIETICHELAHMLVWENKHDEIFFIFMNQLESAVLDQENKFRPFWTFYEGN
jgi:hypothetical protein